MKLQNTIIASFQAKIDWERPRKGENKKKKSFGCVPTRSIIKNSKKIAKKLKKLENTIIVSFQAKIGQERLRKREKKKSFFCIPTRLVIENSKKIAKKIQKIREHHHSFFPGQNRLENAKKERK